MPRRLRNLAFCLLLLTLCIGYLLQRAIQEQPEVDAHWAFSKEEIVKARKILDEGSTVSDKPLKKLVLNERELNLLANYLLNRHAKGSAKIGLHNDSLSLLFTLQLPETPFGRYLNIRAILTFGQPHRLPMLSEFKVGKQHIIPAVANYAVDAFIRHSSLRRYQHLASNQIEDIALYANQVSILYRFDANAYLQARQLLKFDTSQEAMHVYHEKLLAVIAQHDPGWRLSLAELLRPLFALAAQRSTADTFIDENKALIFTVAAYVNDQKMPALLGAHADATPRQRVPVYAYKRVDIPQHFMASAALSAAGNWRFADGIGVEKELQDAKGGSGFSFIDLAADRAGLRFGSIAVSSAENARRLQLAMAQIDGYQAFIPDITDLPEKMDEATFLAKFASVDSPATQALIDQIDARLDNSPIFTSFKDMATED